MIAAAAVELFHERGYRGTNIDDIGVAVGISGPAIYRHFQNKEAILIALIEDSVRRGLADVRVALRAKDSPNEVLHQLVRKSVDFAIADRKLVELADRELHHVSPERRKHIVSGLRGMLRGWMAL